MESVRPTDEKDSLIVDILHLTQVQREREILWLQNQLFVGMNLSFEDLKVYFLLLRAYIQRARENKPFYGIVDIAQAITREAAAYRKQHGRPLTSTHRQTLLQNLRRLRNLPGDGDFAILMQSKHSVEVSMYPFLWRKSAPYRRTWKKKCFFPFPISKGEGYEYYTPEELEAFMEPLLKGEDQFGNTIPELEKIFGQPRTESFHFPPNKELRKQARKLLSSFMRVPILSSSKGWMDIQHNGHLSLLYAFSVEELQDHLKKRIRGNQNG